MPKDTKSRLLESALEIFSENGYSGTNIRELSASLGLGKSSLYRHFKSKEEIWNALIDEMENYYAQRFGSANALPPVPKSTDELKSLTVHMLYFTINDKKIIMTRKLLLTEQFRDERIRRIATEHFNTGFEEMFSKLFRGMMQNGSLKGGDPDMLAFAYTAPISTLVHLCDREPERRTEIMNKAEAYIEHFVSVYGAQENKSESLNMINMPSQLPVDTFQAPNGGMLPK